MLKRVLEQMQFINEHTGGGCNCMSLYKDGHVIVVSIDAMTNFEMVSPNLEIAVGVYRTMTEYGWGDCEPVWFAESSTQSDAISAVIDALDYIQQESAKHYAEGVTALTAVWKLLEDRHGLDAISADEVTQYDLGKEWMPEVQAFRLLWDALTGTPSYVDRVKNGPLQPTENQGVSA